MWALKNRTKYAAERGWARDREGNHLWLVAVKATFTIREDGRVELADEQPPALLAPEYVGEPAASSVLYEKDVVPTKPTTDVIVNAHAHAPRGVPARSVDVAVRVGPIAKELRVLGPRMHQGSGAEISTPDPFVEFPLLYEWAYGGADLSDPDPQAHRIDGRNPIGKGFTVHPGALVDQPAWRIEYRAGDPATVGPAGLGAIAAWWSPRREFGGTYDEAWDRDRKPVLPADYDERVLLCAPRDQQAPEHLRGGETVRLENLTPNGLLQFDLPKIYPVFMTRVRGARLAHRAKLGTICIEPEIMRLELVFQTSLGVPPAQVDDLDETLIWEKRYL